MYKVKILFEPEPREAIHTEEISSKKLKSNINSTCTRKVVPVPSMKLYGEVELWHHSFLNLALDKSGQLDAPAASPPRKNTRWAPEQGRTFWRRERNLATGENRTKNPQSLGL